MTYPADNFTATEDAAAAYEQSNNDMTRLDWAEEHGYDWRHDA